MSWNPRYENYARFHGRAPQDQIEHDKRHWAGGSMTGFVLWNNARLREAAAEIPEAFFMGKLSDHDRYDAWLTAWVDKATKEMPK